MENYHFLRASKNAIINVAPGEKRIISEWPKFFVMFRAEGLGFDSRVGLAGRSSTNGSPPLRRFFGAVLPRRLDAKMAPPLVTRFGVIMPV